MAEEKGYKEEFSSDELSSIFKTVNRYYQELTITKVSGNCPYGHKEGDTFKVTSVNHDGLCGSLYQAIHPHLVTLHYGGSVPWEKDPASFEGLCPEMGKVQVKITRYEKEPGHFKTRTLEKVKVTGKDFSGLDRYRVFVEILGVARNCMWGHGEGQRFEIDPFNIGGVCGFLYWEAYHFMNLLFSGGSLPWEAEGHVIHGACPDLYNQVLFRLVREER